MALESQTRQIGESEYKVTQFGAKLGNRVLLKVVKAIAPMFALAAGNSSLRDLDSSAVAAALAGVSESDFEWLVDQFAGATDVLLPDGRSPGLRSIFEVHFAGKYSDELAWLAFCLEVNFGLFFQEMKQKARSKTSDAVVSPGTPSS